jgi:hypothetical protein
LLARVFSHSVSILWSPVTVFFSLSCWDIGVLFMKSLPMPICSSVFPMTFYGTFKVSGHVLRSLMHFELIFASTIVHYTRDTFFNFSFLKGTHKIFLNSTFFVSLHYFYYHIIVLVIHCDIYKNSSNMSQLNSPPLSLSFIPPFLQ